MPNHDARRRKLCRLLRQNQVDALLVTNFVNVTYLTGFTGDDSYLLVTLDGATLISDMRYTTQLEEECPGLKLVIRAPGEHMTPAVSTAVKKARVETLGVESSSMTLAGHQTLTKQFKEDKTKAQVKPVGGLVEQLRLIKDKSEIEATRVAAMQARRAFEVVRAGITLEATENEVAAELEYQARKFGAKGLSFDPIVAVGPRGALPHARPTNKKIGESDFTLIDWGANSGLYMSDLTRMLVTGKLTAKFKKIYGIVLRAQVAAIEAIAPGVECQKVDGIARKIITKAGFGKEFGHGLGHGTGLEIHEGPRLSSNQETKLEPGMIVTVEPGIYLPGWGGIRIEDDVLVTSTGYELLTDVPKAIEDCVVG